jgi:hypothetical protein
VELITTDGFLRPNAELEGRGLMARKGFPESYDRRALLQFVREVKAGSVAVAAPVYSHLVYDVVPDEQTIVRRPDILLLEGLNVLQPAGRAAVAVSDFIDFSVYVDAATADIRHWYVERFLRLRETAFRNPESYFRRYAALNVQEAIAQAESIWAQINEPNLERNIRPTRGGPAWCCTKDPTTTSRDPAAQGVTALWWQDGRMEAGSTAVAGEAVHGVSDELATRLRLAVGRLSRRVRIDGGESVPPLQLSALVTVEGHGPLRLSELPGARPSPRRR